MSQEPDINTDPLLSFATTEQLIDELGKRCHSLLVVFNQSERGTSKDFRIELYRRKALVTEAMGLAEYAKQRLYDTLVHGPQEPQ